MTTSTLTSKGQITIPKRIRELLALEIGDRVVFHVRDDGAVVLAPANVDLRTLRGMIKPRKRGVSVEGMKEAVRRMGGRR